MATPTRATVILGTWPPPTIELHGLLAALNEWTADSEAAPATAYQHLNEIQLTFTFDVVEGTPPATTAQKVVHHAMAKVYDGPITVNVDSGRPVRPARPRTVDVRGSVPQQQTGPYAG